MRLPEEYRREAARIRAMAAATPDPSAKDELLKMAAAFERLATRAEQQHFQPRTPPRVRAARRLH